MSDTPAVDISVLIATRSHAELLERTLESHARMNLSGLSWEVVVVDNGSTDATPEVLRKWMGRLPLRVLNFDGAGQNRARNTALDGLLGRLTVLSDDDTCVDPEWLQQWKAGTERWPEDVLFAGRIVPRFPEGCAEWISSARFPFRSQCFAEFGPGEVEGPCSRTPFGPNFAVRTELMKTLRFREDMGPTAGSYAMGGETELSARIKALGKRVIYLPGPCVEHVLTADNLQLDKLLQRGFNAGRGDELRRALRLRWSRPTLWLRTQLLMPLKIALYSAISQLSVLLQVSMHHRFERLYKLHAARGRRHQLRELLAHDNRLPT